jgi:hypothetical protein
MKSHTKDDIFDEEIWRMNIRNNKRKEVKREE